MKTILREIVRVARVAVVGVICVADMFGQGISYPPEPQGMPDSETNGKNVFFIHGFNVSEQEARGWNAEMFKRLYQSGMRAKFHAVSWEGDAVKSSGGNPALNYHQNVVNAFEAAAGGFAWMINSLEGEKIIIAHSLGNMLASAAIQDHGMVVDKYFALNSAVPAEAYDASPYNSTPVENVFIHSDWADYRIWAWASTWHLLFDASDWRSTLTWHGRFKDVPQRTAMYNYYSSGDEVLEIYENGTPTLLQGKNPFDKSTYGRYAWHKQESHKGRDTRAGTDQMGWGFHKNRLGQPYYSAAQANDASFGALQRRPVFRRDPPIILSADYRPLSVCNRILAFGIPALSRLAGTISVGVSRGVFNFDMHTLGRKQDTTGKWIWPRGENSNVFGIRWLHSDIRDVAYLYTHPVFLSIVEHGELK